MHLCSCTRWSLRSSSHCRSESTISLLASFGVHQNVKAPLPFGAHAFDGTGGSRSKWKSTRCTVQKSALGKREVDMMGSKCSGSVPPLKSVAGASFQSITWGTCVVHWIYLSSSSKTFLIDDSSASP